MERKRIAIFLTCDRKVSNIFEKKLPRKCKNGKISMQSGRGLSVVRYFNRVYLINSGKVKFILPVEISFATYSIPIFSMQNASKKRVGWVVITVFIVGGMWIAFIDCYEHVKLKK